MLLCEGNVRSVGCTNHQICSFMECMVSTAILLLAVRRFEAHKVVPHANLISAPKLAQSPYVISVDPTYN